MNHTTDRGKETGGKGKKRLKKTLVPALTVILVIAITISLHLIYGRHPERLLELTNYVYWGALIISLIGNATIILPGAVLLILTNMGILLYPVTGPSGPIMVGLAGGAGAAIGEITGYMVGYSGRGVIEGSNLYSKLLAWMRRWGIVIIFIFSLVPPLFDLVGMAAGALRFPLWKFVLLTYVGRTILYISVVLAGALGYQSILLYFS